MLPLRDENPTLRVAYAVIAIIVLNALSWAFLQGLGTERSLVRSLCLYGLIPGDLLGSAPIGTTIALGPELLCQIDGGGAGHSLLTSMFMHGGWFHILGNMWFLWVFGDNVEDAMGPLRFAAFYVICGLAAAAAQIVTDPGSLVPMVGASGAIGGVMGAYARLFPQTRVHTLIFLGFFVTTVSIPAIWMLGYWFVIQLVGGLPALAGAQSGGGVAFWAHIGGFAAGLLLIGPMHRRDYLQQHRALGRRELSRYRW